MKNSCLVYITAVMNIIRNLIRTIFILIILFLVSGIFRKADSEIYGPSAHSRFSTGDAPDSIRKEVLNQLQKLQDGYSRRDISIADAFIDELYSKETILILGTMPGEIYIGSDRARQLITGDWDSWGDCVFNIDSANISSNGNTVWFSTTGIVRFDLTPLLELPLRLTGIMVKEKGIWKFRQQQFQFDIDFSLNLLAIILISAWLAISLVYLSISIVKTLRSRKGVIKTG